MISKDFYIAHNVKLIICEGATWTAGNWKYQTVNDCPSIQESNFGTFVRRLKELELDRFIDALPENFGNKIVITENGILKKKKSVSYRLNYTDDLGCKTTTIVAFQCNWQDLNSVNYAMQTAIRTKDATDLIRRQLKKTKLQLKAQLDNANTEMNGVCV